MGKLIIAIGSSDSEKDKGIIDTMLREHGFIAEYRCFTTHGLLPEKGIERARMYAEEVKKLFGDAEYSIGIDRSENDLYTVTQVVVIPKTGQRGKGAWIRHPVVSPDSPDSYSDDVREAVWDALGQLLGWHTFSDGR